MPRKPVGVSSSKVKMNKDDYYKRRMLAARAAMIDMSYSQAAKQFGLSKRQVQYWVSKLQSNKVSLYTHGGKRYEKMTPYDKKILRLLATKYPKTDLETFAKALQLYTGTIVTPATISLTFKSFGWSYHKIEYKQQLKYTYNNMKRYSEYVRAMPDIVDEYGFERIKYLDEVHFVTRQLHKKYGVGPRCKRIMVKTGCDLSESYSMTLMTSLGRKIPVVASMRTGSNSQFDFGVFIAKCIRAGHICKGDVIIMDNASVHVGFEVFSKIHEVFDKLGVRLVLLPAYSPELNPAEYIFAFVKNTLRYNRNASLPLWRDIMRVLTTLSRETVLSMYWRCIYQPKMG